MRLPAAPLSAESICAALGPDHKTNTWNVKWQVPAAFQALKQRASLSLHLLTVPN